MTELNHPDIIPDGTVIEPPVKQVHPAARKQPPVVRDRQVPEQARLLWQVLRNYAQREYRLAEGGYYLDIDIVDVAKPMFQGVAWDHPKHVSNFLRPILANLGATGNIKILGRVGRKSAPFHYRLWIRSEWHQARTKGTGVVRDNGYSPRAMNTTITCPCGATLLSNAAYSQHKKACETYQERQRELAAQAAQAEAERQHLDETEAFVPVDEAVGVSRDEYGRAMAGGRTDASKSLQARCDRYEATLRSLQRDWRRRTPDALANLFQTLDELVL